MSCLFRSTPARVSAPARPLIARRTSQVQALSTATRPAVRSTSASAAAGPPQKRSLFLLSSALVSGGLVAGLGLSLVLPRPQLVNLVFPLPTPHPPPPASPEAEHHAQQLERALWDLAVVRALQAEMVESAAPASPTAGPPGADSVAPAAGGAAALEPPPAPRLVPRWKVSRPYAATPAGPHSLSGYALRGPHRFAIPPVVFTSPDLKEAVFVLHVGKGLCGHEGVVHGGLLATVLDESLGRTALLNLPTNIGVTATLNLKYKKPTFADQYIVIKTRLVAHKGRKAWVEGTIESTDGERLVEAEALFVEPKMARFLNNSSVREALK
ncbi:hypothetical protein JCM11491_004862 [Sporobolomyces phaffii]